MEYLDDVAQNPSVPPPARGSLKLRSETTQSKITRQKLRQTAPNGVIKPQDAVNAKCIISRLGVHYEELAFQTHTKNHRVAVKKGPSPIELYFCSRRKLPGPRLQGFSLQLPAQSELISMQKRREVLASDKHTQPGILCDAATKRTPLFPKCNKSPNEGMARDWRSFLALGHCRCTIEPDARPRAKAKRHTSHHDVRRLQPFSDPIAMEQNGSIFSTDIFTLVRLVSRPFLYWRVRSFA